MAYELAEEPAPVRGRSEIAHVLRINRAQIGQRRRIGRVTHLHAELKLFDPLEPIAALRGQPPQLLIERRGERQMLRHLLRADVKRRPQLVQASDMQPLGAQLCRQLAGMGNQFGLRRVASRWIQPVGVAHPAVVDIRHRRELTAVKKAAHENKWRRGDRAAAPVLSEQVMGIESVRRADHLAPLPKMARGRVSAIRDQFIPIRPPILAANYNAQL